MEKRIPVLFVGVSDMGRATDFYTNVLELKVKFASESYTELEAENVAIALVNRPANTVGPSFTIASAQMEKDLAFLKKHGIKFCNEVRHEDYGTVAEFFDSEGNIIELVQYNKQPPD